MEDKSGKKLGSAKTISWAAQLGAGGLLLRRHVGLLAISAALGLALIALKKKNKNSEKPTESKERDEEDFKNAKSKHRTVGEGGEDEEERTEEEAHQSRYDVAHTAPSIGDALISESSQGEMKHTRYKMEKQTPQREPEKIVEEKIVASAREVEPKTIEVVEEESREATRPDEEEDADVDVKEAAKLPCTLAVVADQEKRETGESGEIQRLTFLAKSSWRKLLLWLSIFLVTLAAISLCPNYGLHLPSSTAL